MRNNFPKFVFLAVVVAAVVFSGAIYPSLFESHNVPANGEGSGSSTKNEPPILVLPSLAADISAQTAVASGSNDTNTSMAVNTSTSSSLGVPAVGASVEMVADLTTGKPFLSVNADERWPLASVSKLMTAAIANDLLNPNQRITITAEMTAADPTEHILNIGDTYTVSDLMRVMLLPSNNIAATALADFAGYARFLAAMNAKAQAWGMTSTYYDDPSGLSAANESSASDLLKLAQHIYAEYPQILAITRMPQATVQNLSTNQYVLVKNINHFAGESDFIGGKTGYTDQADGNLLSIFQYGGRPIFIVVLGIDDGVRFDATQQLYAWLKTNFK